MKPTARLLDLLVEELDGEAVIYDQRSNLVHHLDERARRIWGASDGHRTTREMAAAVGCDQALVEATLIELHNADLLMERPRPRLHNRRQLLTAGAALAATPTITSVTAPTPAMAQSPMTELCSGRWECIEAGGCDCIRHGERAPTCEGPVTGGCSPKTYGEICTVVCNPCRT
jgi:hypothetical protein